MTRPSRLARYGFGDNGARAIDLLGPTGLRLWDLEAQEPADTDAAELIHALSRAADPNLALRQLHRLVESAGRAAVRGNGGRVTGPSDDIEENSATDAVLDALYRDTGLRRRLVAVLGASSALGDHLVAYRDQWGVLATGKTGLPPNAEGHLELGDSMGDRPPAVPALRQAYRVALLRIAAADLTGGRGLEPTMASLSRLADETLATAYAIAVDGLPGGTPEPRLAVVAMGKAGGNELNYVSDVDVIFVAAGGDDLTAGPPGGARGVGDCGQGAGRGGAA